MDDVKIGDIVIHRSQQHQRDAQRMVVETIGPWSLTVSWIDCHGTAHLASIDRTSLALMVSEGKAELTPGEVAMQWQVTKGAKPEMHPNLAAVLDGLNAVKEEAVNVQQFEAAAQIRELMDKLKKSA